MSSALSSTPTVPQWKPNVCKSRRNARKSSRHEHTLKQNWHKSRRNRPISKPELHARRGTREELETQRSQLDLDGSVTSKPGVCQSRRTVQMSTPRTAQHRRGTVSIRGARAEHEARLAQSEAELRQFEAQRSQFEADREALKPQNHNGKPHGAKWNLLDCVSRTNENSSRPNVHAWRWSRHISMRIVLELKQMTRNSTPGILESTWIFPHASEILRGWKSSRHSIQNPPARNPIPPHETGTTTPIDSAVSFGRPRVRSWHTTWRQKLRPRCWKRRPSNVWRMSMPRSPIQSPSIWKNFCNAAAARGPHAES